MPCCGLANRVRLLVNAHLFAQRSGARLTIVWAPSPICGANFNDILEPHPQLNVIDWRTWYTDSGAPCLGGCVRWQHESLLAPGRQLRKSESPDNSAGMQCDDLKRTMGFERIFAGANLDASLPPADDAPSIIRGCGLQFSDAQVDAHACSALVSTLRPRRELRALVSRLLPADPMTTVGVHLRPPDTEMDVAHADSHWGLHNASLGRRLSQGHAVCHPVELFSELVAKECAANPKLTSVYVASGSASYLLQFKHSLYRRLGPSSSALPGDAAVVAVDGQPGDVEPNPLHRQRQTGGRRHRALPRVLSLADLLRLDGAPVKVPRPPSEGPWSDGGRDTVFGMQGAVLDLWALASTSKVFRTGESTFGMLASALHTRPAEVVVRNTSNPQCRSWSAMYPLRIPGNGTLPAFCAPRRGSEEAHTCRCLEDGAGGG